MLISLAGCSSSPSKSQVLPLQNLVVFDAPFFSHTQNILGPWNAPSSFRLKLTNDGSPREAPFVSFMPVSAFGLREVLALNLQCQSSSQGRESQTRMGLVLTWMQFPNGGRWIREEKEFNVVCLCLRLPSGDACVALFVELCIWRASIVRGGLGNGAVLGLGGPTVEVRCCVLDFLSFCLGSRVCCLYNCFFCQ